MGRIDHAEIGRQAALHLLERGYRHFAFAGFSDEFWAAQRLKGFCTAVRSKGFSVRFYESPWRGPRARRWDEDSPTWKAVKKRNLGRSLNGLQRTCAVCMYWMFLHAQAFWFPKKWQ